MGVRDMDSPTLLKGAEPFFYPGNDIGCLVLHGFTGTPGEVRWLGRHLNKQGYTVYGPRLAGHGTHVGDMAYPTWREWYLDALAGYHLLLRQCRKIFVTGLSMGGALALALASREAVDGVAGLAAFYRLPPAVELFVPLAAILIPVWPKNSPPSDDNPFQRRVREEQTRRGEEPIGHPTYRHYPVRGVSQAIKLLRFARARLGDITAPVLLMHSRADDVLPLDRHLVPYDQAITRAASKQVVILERSLHVITEDVERETVFQTVAEFVAAHT